MPMEIRHSNLVIFSNANTIHCDELKLGLGEKLLALWYVPTDNVGSQLFGYVTITPRIFLGDQVVLDVEPLASSPPPGSNRMGVTVFAMVDVPLRAGSPELQDRS